MATTDDDLPNNDADVTEAKNDPGDTDPDERLREKYAEQTRQIFPQKIELPISTLLAMVADQIDLSPNFQRRDVWDTKKQSRFIESLIMNVPSVSDRVG